MRNPDDWYSPSPGISISLNHVCQVIKRDDGNWTIYMVNGDTHNITDSEMRKKVWFSLIGVQTNGN